MAYRDDLEAAQVRIRHLEAECVDQRSQVVALRAELTSRGQRRPWGWLAIGGVATLVLVGAGAGQALYARDHVTGQRVVALEQQLARAEGDVAAAREESRLAHEMFAHSVAQQQAGLGEAPDRSEVDQQTARDLAQAAESPDPSEVSSTDGDRHAQQGSISVVSDRVARVTVDGTSVHGWTPTTVWLEPGPHSINVIAAEGGSRQQRVRVWQGHNQQLRVSFE